VVAGALPGTAACRALGDPRSRPDPQWIAALTGYSQEAIGAWLAECDAELATERAIRASHRAGGRSSYAQFRAPFDLYALVRALRPTIVVETGVSSGVSSAHILMALRKNRSGRLISIDLPTRQAGPRLRAGESPVSLPPGRDPGWAVPTRLRRGWDLRIGPSQELLPKVVRSVDRIDLFLHDDLHTPRHLAFELRTLEPKLADHAVVLADNTQWTGTSFDAFARRHRVPVHRRRASDLVGTRLV
jgi:hypothetical protein